LGVVTSIYFFLLVPVFILSVHLVAVYQH